MSRWICVQGDGYCRWAFIDEKGNEIEPMQSRQDLSMPPDAGSCSPAEGRGDESRIPAVPVHPPDIVAGEQPAG